MLRKTRHSKNSNHKREEKKQEIDMKVIYDYDDRAFLMIFMGFCGWKCLRDLVNVCGWKFF